MNSSISSQGSSSSISQSQSSDILKCEFTGMSRNKDLSSAISRFTGSSFVQCKFTLDGNDKDINNEISRQTEASLAKLGLIGRIYSDDIINTIRRGKLILEENVINVSIIYSDKDDVGVLTNVDILLELGDGTFLDLGDGITFLKLN